MEKKERKGKGGRPKGSPNRLTAFQKGIISGMLAEYHDSGQMREDFLGLPAKDRILVAEKLMNYVMPKMQAVAADIGSGTAAGSVAERLALLAGGG